MRNSLLLLILTTLFYSCNDPRTDDARSSTDVAPTRTDVARNVSTFKGLYTFGNEINTFRDCSTQTTYWVNDSLADLRKPYEQTLRSMSYPYESIYAEVKGYLAGKSSLGYASEYENVLVVTEVVKLEAKNYRTACYDYEFIALGNEPFWAVDIIPTEQQIVLKDVGADKVYQFPYQPANIGGGVHRYETTNGAKDKLVIVIREEPCSDGMSDSQYSYSAEIVINGRILKGCAIRKGDLPKNPAAN